MILEQLTSIAFDDDQSIKSVQFLNESGESIGRGSTKILITAGSRLLPLIEELYQEFADGYGVSYPDPIVTSIKIKWEEQNPVKVDIGINAKATIFGSYSTTLKSPSTLHVTSLNSLIRRISDAAFMEYASYDKAVPAYNEPIYEQTNLFAVPNLTLEKEAA